tara:strand:+ start:533 stop:769 length:237 start_codon:yes stop_codon:yes gene_type:complete
MKKLVLILALAMAQNVHAESELEALIATVINLNGHLCASVTRMYLRGGDTYEVVCKEYRRGSSAVRYVVNMKTMAVSR